VLPVQCSLRPNRAAVDEFQFAYQGGGP
jgi:hypothetical protein